MLRAEPMPSLPQIFANNLVKSLPVLAQPIKGRDLNWTGPEPGRIANPFEPG